jgi:hypothetical protein
MAAAAGHGGQQRCRWSAKRYPLGHAPKKE